MSSISVDFIDRLPREHTGILKKALVAVMRNAGDEVYGDFLMEIMEQMHEMAAEKGQPPPELKEFYYSVRDSLIKHAQEISKKMRACGRHASTAAAADASASHAPATPATPALEG